MSRSPGRHFLQIPGPTNTPLSILAAIAKPTIDHRDAKSPKTRTFRSAMASVLSHRVLRVGHLGDFSDASVLGTLVIVEMGLKAQGVPFGDGAIEALSDRRLVMAEAAE
jgi:aspartate aminotransferase-like enzyme